MRQFGRDPADGLLTRSRSPIERPAEDPSSDARASGPRVDQEAGPKRFGLISPCGWGNLGDAAILEAAIHNIRRLVPDAEIVAFTQNPADTEKKHAIPAGTLLGFSRSSYGIREPAADARAATAVPPPSPGSMPASPVRSALGALRRRLTSAPLLGPVFAPFRAARSSIRLVRAELDHLSRSRRAVSRLDLLIVAGGGQLDDLWGGPWGHPYVLCRWALLARLCGVPFVVLSVGTGTVRGRLSRWFIARALRWAAYRSFRDRGSRDLAAFAAATRSDPVVPDLAFSYPIELDHSPALVPSSPRRCVVGVAPMCFADPRCWPEKDAAFYQTYVRKMADFVARVSSSGFDVVLFATTQVSDRRTVQDVEDQLVRDGHRAGYAAREAESARSLLDGLRDLDVVVACRLHGVLLAHLAGNAVLAISHERKVDAVMEDFENEEFCLDIRTFDVDALIERFRRLVARREEVVERNLRKVRGFREQLREQYDRILGVATPDR